MKRIAIASAAMLAATAANAQCLGTNCRSGPDDITRMQNSNMYYEQMRTMQNLNRQMETMTPRPMPEVPAMPPVPDGPGLLGTIVGLSQQSELHEKQMQVLEAQRRQISGTQAPAADDDFHPTRMTGEASGDDFKPKWMRRRSVVSLREYCMAPSRERAQDCELWVPK